MKILHVIVGLDVGGGEVALQRLVESHRRSAEFQHSVISLRGVGKIGEQLRAHGTVVTAVHMKSALHMPRALRRLVKIIRKTQPDLVQTWMYHADLLGGVAARLVGNIPVIWGLRTAASELGFSARAVRALCARLSTSIPSAIVSVAEAAVPLHMSLGYEAKRMRVIGNGFDTQALSKSAEARDMIRATLSIDKSTMIIGSLGRFHYHKDQPTFVAAAGLIAQKINNVQFLMVGRGLTKANQELRKLIEATGHPDRFLLLGERSDVAACLSAMDLYCLSSLAEGFPNALGEAMSVGLPCVTTDVGDAAHMLAEPEQVVPKESPRALADALLRLLNMSGRERDALGQAARERIDAKFSLAQVTARYETLYKELLQETGK